MDPILIDLPMPILTPRLRIQPRHTGEGQLLNKAICDSLDHLKTYLPFARKAPTIDESESHCRKAAAQFLLRENFTLSIYERESGRFVGSTGLHKPNWDLRSFEIGYWIAREFEGKGYVTESTNALTRYAFEVMKARRLEIRCDTTNTRSLAVMKRLGFVLEGTFKSDSLDEEGELRDTYITARQNLEGLSPLEVSWK